MSADFEIICRVVVMLVLTKLYFFVHVVAFVIKQIYKFNRIVHVVLLRLQSVSIL